MNAVDFCNCSDKKCPLHPTNHDKGCSLCIQKCLKVHEIPSCFFYEVVDEFTPDMDFTFDCFANLVKK